MHKFKIHDCKYCNQETQIGYYRDIFDVIKDIQKGLAGCSKCKKENNYHTDFEISEFVQGRWIKV